MSDVEKAKQELVELAEAERTDARPSGETITLHNVDDRGRKKPESRFPDKGKALSADADDGNESSDG